MRKLRGSIIFVGAAGSAIFVSAIVLPQFFTFTHSVLTPTSDTEAIQAASVSAIAVATHLKTPEPLKALYMTSCVAGTPSWRAELKNLIETTELNAVVIDIKDYTGVVSFPNDFPKTDVGRGCVVSDMVEFVRQLHESDIYVIGRISVFQDISYVKIFPALAVKRKSDGEVWKDYKGLTFIDVGAKPYWDYILEISKMAYKLGFDELNYDYVRYPSDGIIEDTLYTWTIGTSTKQMMLESFFEYLSENMKDSGAKLSVDLFGMTTTVENDMGIGQVLESALPYFDYVSPMVYPSHYPPTWNGFINPAEYPYEVVKISLMKGIERERAQYALINFASSTLATSTPSKFRPWLQDFNLGATYTPEMIRAQVQAVYDVGLTSWMLWSAANKYTREALFSN